jgi:hypothetical protein
VKRILAAITMVATAAALAHGAPVWNMVLHPLTAQYTIFGGAFGDTYAPVAGDIRIAFYLRGAAARQMFDAIGPDKKKGECGTEEGRRMRERGDISCSHDPKQGYECDFGLDLTSGRSTNGSIC